MAADDPHPVEAGHALAEWRDVDCCRFAMEIVPAGEPPPLRGLAAGTLAEAVRARLRRAWDTD